MLIPRSDAASSDEEWQAFLGSRDFGQLIAPGDGRAFPVVVPAHYRYDMRSTIELHLDRRNPVWATLQENPRAIFTVIDGHVYIPTSWNANPGTSPEWGAPTSYYATVQAFCQASILDEPQALADLLTRQLCRMQPEGGHRAVEPGQNPYGRMLSAIRGLQLHITEVHARFKFGGNKSPEHRLKIAAQLRARGGPLDIEAARHLLQRLRLQREATPKPARRV